MLQIILNNQTNLIYASLGILAGLNLILWMMTRRQAKLFNRVMRIFRQKISPALSAAEQNYYDLVQGLNSLIICMSPAGEITFVNKYAQDLFEYEEHEILGKNIIGTLIPERGESGRDLSNLMEKIKENPEKYIEHEHEAIKKSGERVWVRWSNKIIYDTKGLIKEIRVIGHDITSRKELEETLRQMASIDQLTGILNRRRFMEIGQIEAVRAQSTKNSLSILLIDIDHFKNVNDTYGHAAGDMVLKNMVKICKKALRKSDTMGRIGGEEFAITLPETGIKEAKLLAQRLRQDVEETKINIGKKLINITISIGIANHQETDENVSKILNRADRALYQAKNNGRNCVVTEQELKKEKAEVTLTSLNA